MLSLLPLYVLGVAFVAYGKSESVFILPKPLKVDGYEDNPVYSLDENFKIEWETGRKGPCNLFVWQSWPRGPLENYKKILGIIPFSFWDVFQSTDLCLKRTQLKRASYGTPARHPSQLNHG